MLLSYTTQNLLSEVLDVEGAISDWQQCSQGYVLSFCQSQESNIATLVCCIQKRYYGRGSNDRQLVDLQAVSAAQAIAAKLSAAGSDRGQAGSILQPLVSAPLQAATAAVQQLQGRPGTGAQSATYNQQPYLYPSPPGTGNSSSSFPLDSAAAQASIAQAQQNASALFAKFQQQNFPSAQPLAQPLKPSRPKWDA